MSALRRLPHCLRDLPCASGLALTLLRTGYRRNGGLSWGRLPAPLVSGDPSQWRRGPAPFFLPPVTNLRLSSQLTRTAHSGEGPCLLGMPKQNGKVIWSKAADD